MSKCHSLAFSATGSHSSEFCTWGLYANCGPQTRILLKADKSHSSLLCFLNFKNSFLCFPLAVRIGRNRTSSEKLRKLRCISRNKPTLENEEPQSGERKRKLGELEVVKVKGAPVWGVCVCACANTHICVHTQFVWK